MLHRMFSLLSCFLCSIVAPEFADPNRSDYIVASGNRVHMNCTVKSYVYPRAYVEWHIREQGVDTGVNMGEWYNISESALEDSGTYTCTARNRLSGPSVSKFVVLKVYGKSS